ncbi:MAG: glycosyltransferase [Candidatus Bacteroides intestinipullorum]|uniref:Glycosyltransferase n=1 Tax=Candidatus Bacteroides intestinipullorum TaxID=2838471 RepID=A0A9E2KGZ3_9BACE|nr:glycosyltransferase [Candidatus Bacteroides intestinipullorum]
MYIVFFSIVLNHHQAPISDALWEATKHRFTFVELAYPYDKKGANNDYSQRPYLLQAWQSNSAYSKAMELACTAECCIFSGVLSLPFQKKRMKKGLLSFDMSERWLKRGILNLFSPTILKMFMAYHIGHWNNKPIYKLCCSAFAAQDQYRLGTYQGKCYKWGYFTRVEKIRVEAYPDVSTSDITPLMWCSRYLKLKHPELPVLMAHRLHNKGYRFTLDLYGSGEYESKTRQLVTKLGLEDVVRIMGAKPNEELLADMRKHSIFLFTSDRNEGWGAVANESMANGCALVASNGIGSAPYLIEDGKTGMLFRSPSTSSSFENPDLFALNSLCEKVEYLLCNPCIMQEIRKCSLSLMQEVWNPKVAAERLLILIDYLYKGQKEKNRIYSNGPCSKA